MSRIFATLSVFTTILLAVTFVLGWMIGDPSVPDPAVQEQVRWHFLTALGALVFAMLVHAIVLTYFMGTGRWIEETSQAYRLGNQWNDESRSLKYRTLPWMAFALVLLILTGAFGAIADPASPAGADGFGGISAATVHFVVASLAFAVNIFVNLLEYSAITRNSQAIREVLGEVNRIRREKGLPVEV